MSAIDQKEYLKRYLPKEDKKAKVKRKKKKQPAVKRTMVIVDDDVDIKALAPAAEEVEMAEEEMYDDAPTVAGVVDERPEEERRAEKYGESTKWKGLNQDDNETDPIGDKTKGISSRIGTDDMPSPRHPQLKNNSEFKSSSLRSRTRDSDSDQREHSGSGHSKENSSHKSDREMRHDNGHSSQRTKQRHDSDSDLSPPRNTKKRHSGSVRSDVSSSRAKQRHDSDSDLSPPRNKKKRGPDSDLSPPRTKQRHDSDSDHSPPRTKKKIGSDGDLPPARGRKRHDSDSDLSPPRNKKRECTPDHSKPSQTRPRHDSDSDLSPPRSRVQPDSDSDLSVRRSRARDDRSGRSVDRKQRDSRTVKDNSSVGDDGKMKKTLSGHKAGLQDAKTLKAENEASRRRQERLFESLGAEESGRNRATIFRDKSGKKRDIVKEKEEEREKERQKAKENEKFTDWGKGMAQKQNQAQMVDYAQEEMAKPMARYAGDEGLDAFLKEQERDGDPMLAMIRQKKSKEKQQAGVKEKPKYKGPAPQPNRFGIPPGYRWDGIDRSSGFEKKRFSRMANNKAMQEVKYKWSVEDM